MGEGVEINNAYFKKISLDNFEAQPFGNTLLLLEIMKFYITMCLALLMIFTDYTKAFDCVSHNKLWKIIKEMGISDYLTCLLRNLYAGQEATVRTGHGTTGSMDWNQSSWTGSKLVKECAKAVYCYPAYLTYMQSTSCKILGWVKHKLELRLQDKYQ